MQELQAYRHAFERLPEGVRAAEAQAERTIVMEASVSGGRSTGMEYSDKTELFVRATGEKTGMVYTENLEEDPCSVLRQALENGALGQAAELMAPADSLMMERFPEEKSAEELHDAALKLEAELKARFEDVSELNVSVSQRITAIGVVNTNGADVSAAVERYDVTVHAAHRTDPLKPFNEARAVSRLVDICADDWMPSIQIWIDSIRPSGRIAPGEYRAVLSARAMDYVLVTAWQLFSAACCQQGRSAISGKLGEKLFADCITICDHKEGPGFAAVLDAEGVRCQNVTVARNGIVTGWMHNLSTAHREGVPSTGNAGRRALLSGNIHTDMTVVPVCFTLESGTHSQEDLIRLCGDGVYICENYDQFHSLNIVSGDFSFPCRAIRIENGRLTEASDGLVMNGNIVDLFANAEALGNTQRIEPMAMYNNYAVSAPAMLVSRLNIAG